LQRRALALCAGLVIGFSLLSVRLVYLHVVMHEEYAAIAERRYVHKESLPARRGTVMDRHGELLARNQTVYTVVADRNHLGDFNYACRGLAKAEGIEASEVKRKYDWEEIRARYLNRVVRVLAQPLGYRGWELLQKLEGSAQVRIVLKRHIEEEECRMLKELVQAERLGGIHFEAGMRRFYPSPGTLSHILGFVNHENVGQEGVEKKMEEVLRGVDGFRVTERDRRRREITAYRGETLEPQDGHHVRLTIDMGLQNIVEHALDKAWEKYRPEKVCAILMNPYTGEILALANRPDFDLQTRQAMDERGRRNWAVCDSYEPGSTFKIIAAAAALDRGLARPETSFYCHWGRLEDGPLTVNDHSAYGHLTLRMVIAKSSNIGAYKIASLLGRKGFYEYMLRFGFSKPTGIELTGESPGRVFPPERWSTPSFSSMAIGYEVAVTPLQMANALAAVANGGFLMKPYLVDSIQDAKGRVISHRRPHVIRRAMSGKAASDLRKILASVVAGS